MHNRSKALSNLTHSTLLVQSRSFNKLWNLMTKRNQFNNFGKTITTFFGQERLLGPCELSISSKCIPDHCCERPFSYMILYIIMYVIMNYFMTPTLGIKKEVKLFFANFVKRPIKPLGKINQTQKQTKRIVLLFRATRAWSSDLCAAKFAHYNSDFMNSRGFLQMSWMIMTKK